MYLCKFRKYTQMKRTWFTWTPARSQVSLLTCQSDYGIYFYTYIHTHTHTHTHTHILLNHPLVRYCKLFTVSLLKRECRETGWGVVYGNSILSEPKTALKYKVSIKINTKEQFFLIWLCIKIWIFFLRNSFCFP